MPNPLSDHLKALNIRQADFARAVGISESYASQLCAEGSTLWPGRSLSLRIREYFGGRITPNDFLPPYEAKNAAEQLPARAPAA